MSDLPKVIIKPSIPLHNENGETTRSSAVSPAPGSPAIRISETETVSRSASFLRRHLSQRFSRSLSQRSDANIEAITLEETTGKKRQPVTLKASFLRRKREEYEGKNRRQSESC